MGFGPWEMAQEQGDKQWISPNCLLHDEQEMDLGGGVQQSHVEVPAGH